MGFVDAEHKNQYDKVLSFFDHLLRKDSPCRLNKEYPLVFDDQGSEIVEVSADHPELYGQVDHARNCYLFVLSEQGAYRAGLAVLIRRIQTVGGRYLSVAFMGSVVTDPQFRQRGFQKILFKKVEEALRPRGIELLILWSNQLEFYQKLGFQLCGLQATWEGMNDVRLGSQNLDVSFADSHATDFNSAWFEAYARKPLVVERTEAEMQKLFQIPQMKIAFTSEAYALMGKGEDFQDICHEWAGPTNQVLACIDRLKEAQPKLRIMSPGFSNLDEELGVLKALEAQNFESRLEYLGMFKALQKDFVMEDIDPEKLKLPFFIWGLDSI